MTEADRIFGLFPEFIREYIYAHSWKELRAVQIAAAHTIFETDHNLLLTSSTASGKTEAAFFPILARLSEEALPSVSVIYIAPLKSLINDQFSRMEELLDMSGIRVTHWHGDVAQSQKSALLQNPSGILQITPESLESLLINRSNEIPRLFSSLRYVIIDEIHTLIGSDRGNQILCQISRISRSIGYSPIRIGLSATIGSPEKAAAWLSAGSGRKTDVPVFPEEKIRWRLALEHFYIQQDQADQASSPDRSRGNAVAALDCGYEYIYDCVAEKKSLIFSNSREETEYVTATMRQIARMRGEKDRFLIHHGNLSASLREEAELKMKADDENVVTCATVTMELGIDIGRLERIVHNEAPYTVSGFLQRLGRSGRRGQPPEMIEVFREENPLPNTPLPQLLPWNLLRAIAIIQLYAEERFIEPPREKKLPFSLLFQQILSILSANGELTAKALAERILALPPFAHVTKENLRTLLIAMVQNDYLQITDEKTLIVGLAGEKLTRSFKFYAVFKDSEDFTVRCGSDEIGTITTSPPIGDRFALAGRVWEVEELDIARKLIYVKSVQGKMEIAWPGDFGEIHTRILERMKQVLEEDTAYPYLKPNAAARLAAARRVARNAGVLRSPIICLGGYTYCLFPWLGTRSFRTLRKYLRCACDRFKLSDIEFEGCYFITFKMEKGSADELIRFLADRISRDGGVDRTELVEKGEIPIFDKYDTFLPQELLRQAYAEDRLQSDEVEKRILTWFNSEDIRKKDGD